MPYFPAEVKGFALGFGGRHAIPAKAAGFHFRVKFAGAFAAAAEGVGVHGGDIMQLSGKVLLGFL